MRRKISGALPLSLRLALLIAATTVASASLLQAQTYYWDGGFSGTGASDASGTWDTLSDAPWYFSTSDASWPGPPTDTSGYTADIGTGSGAASYTITMGTPITVGTINFASSSTGSYAIAPDANSDQLTVASAINLNSGAATINAPITLAGPNFWTNSSSGTISFNGAIANGGNLLTLQGTGNIAINSAISGGGGLTKSGSGVVSLGALNTYIGPTTVSQGTLRIANSGLPANFSLNGTFVNGYQDFFNTGTLNSAWTAVGSGTAGSFTLVGTGPGAYLNVTTSSGDPNHLLYEPAGLAPSNNMTILALVSMNSNFTNDDNERAGIGAGVSGTTSQGIEELLRPASGGADTNGSNQGVAMLSDQVAWGPTLSPTTTTAWTTGTKYWMQLTENGSTETALFWPADGVTPESSAASVSWTQAGTSGFGGITSSSGGALNMNVYYILIENSGLPAITVGGVGAVPSTTALTVAADGTFDLNGTNQQVASLSDSTPGSSGAITNNSTTAPAVLSVATPSGTSTFSGKILDGTSPIGLTLNGTGTQILAGINTYSGPTTISSGALLLATNAAGSPNSTFNVNVSGGLSFGAGVTAPSLGALAGSGNITLTTSDSLPVTLTVGNNNASTTYTGALSGSGNLSKIGSGILTIGASNSYAGTTTVTQGTLRLGAPLSPSIPTNIPGFGTVVNGFQDAFVGTTLNSVWQGNSSAIVNNGLTLNGSGGGFLLYKPTGSAANYTSGPVTISAEITYTNVAGGDGGRAGLTADNAGNGGQDESFLARQNNNGVGDYHMTILDESAAWGTSSPAGVWSYNTPYWVQETWNPTTNQVTGEMWAITNGQIGSTPIVNIAFKDAPSGSATGYVGFYLGGGDSINVNYALIQSSALPAIVVGGSGNIPSTSSLVIATGATFDLNGTSQQVASLSDASSGSQGIITNSASGAAILSLATSGTSTFSGMIQNGEGTVGLTLNGGGTQILAGTNSYTGPTTVSNGTLRVTSAGTLGTGNLSIAGGAIVTLQNATQTVAGMTSAGVLNLTGNLTVTGGMTLQAGSTTNFTLGSTSASALIQTTTSSGASLTVSGLSTIGFGSVPQIGTYDLISYTGGAPNSSYFSLANNLPSGFNYQLVNNVRGSQIDLIITGPPISWTGNSPSSSWDTTLTNTTAWVNPSGGTGMYADQQGVVFGDTYPTNGTGGTANVTPTNLNNVSVVIQPDGVNPSLVSFTNSALNYTISNGGANGIGGGANITLSGTGTVTFASPNSFTGSVSLSAGQLNIQDSGTLGSGSNIASGVDVGPGAALQLQGTTAEPNISIGDVPLSIAGAGFTGNTNGALQSVNGANSYAGPIGIGVGGATITSSSTTVGDGLTLTGGITNNGNLLTINGAGNVTISSLGISGTGGLAFTGSGLLTLGAANSYTGLTTLSGTGTLRIPTGGSLTGATEPVSVSNGLLIANGTSTYGGGTRSRAARCESAEAPRKRAPRTNQSLSSGPVGVGTVTLNGGTLQDNGSAITLANSFSVGGTVTFASTGGGSLTLDGTGLATPATVALSADSTLVVNNTTTINDVIGSTGAGINTSGGTGSLTLGGANTFTGGTTINPSSSSSVIYVNNPSALQNSVVTINDTSGIVFNSAIGQFSLGGLSGSVPLTLSDAGNTPFALTLGNSNTTGSSSASYSGNLTGTSLLKVGSNTQTLSGNNTFTSINVSNGTLAVLPATSGSPLGTAPVTLSGGTLAIQGGGLAGYWYYDNGATSQSNFADYPTAVSHFAGLGAPYLTTNSTATTVNNGLNFDFGPTGAGFPPPFNSNNSTTEAYYQGYINIPKTGNYTFGLDSDDGSMLFIDGATVVTNNNNQGVSNTIQATGTVNLTAGYHTIMFTYDNTGGGFGLDTYFNAGTTVNDTEFLPNSLLSTTEQSQSYAVNNVTVTANSTISVSTPATLGTLSIGSNTLTIAGASNLTMGATNLTGNPTFNVSSPYGSLALGSLADGGTPRTINFSSGAVNLNATASSLVQGTAVNVTGTALNLNATSALGTTANVSLFTGASGAAASLSLGANQTFSALNGSGSVNLNSNTLTVGNTADHLSSSFSGTLRGAGGLTVNAGSGGLTLNAAQSYGGATIVQSGTLRIGQSQSLPVTSGLVTELDASTLAPGAISQMPDLSGNGYSLTQGTGATVVAGGMNGRNVVQFNGSQWLAAAQSNTSTAYTVFTVAKMNTTSGTQRLIGSENTNYLIGWWNGSANDLFLNGWVNGNGANPADQTTVDTATHIYSFTVTGSNTTFYDLANSATPLASNNGGNSPLYQLELGGYNQANELSNGDVAEVDVYNGALSAAQIQQMQAYLQAKWMGVGALPSINNALPSGTPLQVGIGGTLDLNGSTQTVASLSDFSAGSGGTITNGAASTLAVLTLAPANGSTTFSGTIQDGNGQTGLTISGSGTQILAGASTYTGPTLVNNGTLRVTGSLGATPVTVGDQIAGHTAALQGPLSGTATILGPVTISSGGTNGNAASINASSGASLTLAGGLTLQGGSISNFTLSAADAGSLTPLVNITGGGFSVVGPGTNQVYISGTSTFSNGTYDLYSVASGTISASNFSLMTTAAAPFLYSLQANQAGTQLDLIVAGSVTWTAATNSNWDTTAASQNWVSGSSPSPYLDGAAVTFGDTNPLSGSPITNANVVIPATQTAVNPASVTFTNNTVAYTISNGSSNTSAPIGISGTTGITMIGAGNVTLAGQNSFSGPVNIQNGQLILQAAGALGMTSGVTVSSGAALTLNGVSASAPLNISGTGLTSSPAGALNNASGNNSYSGQVTLVGDATIGSTTGTLSLTGGISTGSGNTLTISGAGNVTVSNAPITGSSALTVSGGNLNLAVASPSFSGTTTVSSGTLRVTNSPIAGSSATGTGPVMVSANAVLGGGGTIGGSVSVASGGVLTPSVGLPSNTPTTMNIGGNLTLAGGSVLDFNLSTLPDNGGSSGYNDNITVTGGLSLAGATVNSGTLDINGSVVPGTYDLINYSPTIIPSPAGWQVSNAPAGYSYSFSTTTNLGQFDLVVTTTAGSDTWASSNDQNYNNANNWQPGAYPNSPGAIAIFGTGSQNMITLSQGYTVGTLEFNDTGNSTSSTLAYTLSNGALTLDNSGNIANVTVIGSNLHPVVQTPLTLADASHSTLFTIANTSSLELDGVMSDSMSVGAPQAITLTGGGTLYMDSNNTYSGGTTIVNGTLSLSTQGVPGTNSVTFAPGNGNTAALSVGTSVAVSNLSETTGSAGSAKLAVVGSGTVLTLNQTSPATFGGALSLAAGAGLVVNQSSGDTLTLTGQPTLGSGSSITVNSGTLSLANSSQVSITGTTAPTVTVASGATLQLAGSAPALSSSSGSTVNITTKSGLSTDGTLSLVGATTQTVGTVIGDSSTIYDSNSVPATTYAGNTIVGDGSNLTATQLLQNTLTIGNGSTVTLGTPISSDVVVAGTGTASPSLSPALAISGSESATSDSSSDPFTAIQAAIASGSITSAAGQQLENRIAALENLAARDPGLDVALLENRILAALPTSDWTPITTASLEDSGSGLSLGGTAFALSSALASPAAGFSPAANVGGTPAAVPEPSTLLLIAIAGIGLLIVSYRQNRRLSGKIR